MFNNTLKIMFQIYLGLVGPDEWIENIKLYPDLFFHFNSLEIPDL